MTQGRPVGEEADDEGELRQLRLRAYGPDADIDTDPAARARLRELEEARRIPAQPAAPIAPRVIPPRPPVPTHSLAARHPDVGSKPDALARASADNPAPAKPVPVPEAVAAAWSRRVARWSRSPRAIAVAAIALAFVLALAIVPGLFADRPAATLRIDASYTDDTAGWIDSNSVYLRQLGVEIDDIVRYQNYEEMQVWASRPGTSQRCIFVVFGNQGLWGLNCTPRGLDPITDVTLGPSAVPPSMRESAPDLPDGSVMRFTLKGDSVEVRIATPDIVDPVAR